MKVRVDPTTFARQRERFALRFCCEDCAHFMPALSRCAHFWPTADHRQEHYRELADPQEVVFCKEFELL